MVFAEETVSDVFQLSFWRTLRISVRQICYIRDPADHVPVFRDKALFGDIIPGQTAHTGRRLLGAADPPLQPRSAPYRSEIVLVEYVYTIEGNTSDSCAERWYPIGYYEILGYGMLCL